MSDPRVPLRLADPAEIAGQISFALRYDERGRSRPIAPGRPLGEFTADRTAEAVLRMLERGGYVIMKTPQAA
ncbi:hypothetical protein BKE38_07265 [Pseudoroseomonas deserti]|uniref:Uncharacterized protein n=1 Tax=Teichococcus deserti TaxID=1817963 RepID=A0A1V2H5H3_9PROT|nr:hypothetical protein [Pseudoroseomonas deserti]ONG56008.1 hypothetical protein BKE38_07265 [Pseudoroseomonas deserti]